MIHARKHVFKFKQQAETPQQNGLLRTILMSVCVRSAWGGSHRRLLVEANVLMKIHVHALHLWRTYNRLRLCPPNKTIS